MNQQSDDSSAPQGSLTGAPTLLWASSAAVATLGAWVLFDALPGINWVLWTAAAVTGLHRLTRAHEQAPRPPLFIRAAPIAIAGAAVFTTSEQLLVLVAVSGIFYLATQMLLSTGLSTRSINVVFAATAPLFAFGNAVVQAARSAVDATSLIRSSRARAWVRGLAITVPVVVAFALLLASADPIFAAWRDAIEALFANWDFVPRSVFFGVLLVIVLGAYSYAATGTNRALSISETEPQRWLGATERLILFVGVAALLWLFLAVQLSYLFGNLPQIPNSGVTFAEYARSGFGELSVVASASALLIVVSERYGQNDQRARALRLLTFAVIAAVLLLLGSAFRRVWLYEDAYGFTTARLYAQVYMCAVAVGLLLLAREVGGALDAGRLFRRAAASATLPFIALIYWNHEAWIARLNIDRFASTGKLDVAYLTTELSTDAIPTIIERLPTLPEPTRSELRLALQEKSLKIDDGRSRRWFEWNLSSSRARRALAQMALAP